MRGFFFELPWIPIRDWNLTCKCFLVSSKLWITLNPYQGLKQKCPSHLAHQFLLWITLNPYQGLKRVSTRVSLALRTLWITLNPYQGLKHYILLSTNKQYLALNYLESLSGIETSPKGTKLVAAQLWITLNPYQGLKQSTWWAVCRADCFELPWIPIRDWNKFPTLLITKEKTLNYLESLSGIETVVAFAGHLKQGTLNYLESLSGIETDISQTPFLL